MPTREHDTVAVGMCHGSRLSGSGKVVALAAMFAQSDFGAGDEDRFWPQDALLPAQTRVVVEAHTADRGHVLIDGSAVVVVDRYGGHRVMAMHHQLVTAAGGFEGMRPLNPRPGLRAALEEQIARVARYCVSVQVVRPGPPRRRRPRGT